MPPYGPTEVGLLPFVDFAYQGLAEGIREDATGLAALTRTGCDLLVASSFSKNFGLYSERVGALSVVCKTDAAAEAVTDRTKRRIVAAAEFWLSKHGDDGQSFIRFDVILVAPGKMPRHIANAFDATP